MNDEQIIDLYWSRQENAITETSKKYGKYCNCIAFQILHNREDSEECVNDTYMKAWDVIPPQRPKMLSAFLGKITRNLALNRYKYYTTEKRGAGQVAFALEELQECIPAKNDTEQIIEDELFVDILNRFLATQAPKTRKIFMRRYWYMSSVKEIAVDYKLSESDVKMTLYRARGELKKILEKEGVSEERLLNLLGQVHDEYIAEANPLIKNRKKRTWVRWCAMAAGICLVLSGAFFGRQAMDVYAMETSYISIDVNPSIELCLNKYDRVIDVIAYNEEGQRVVDCLDVKNKCYTDALEEILHNEVFCSYMGEESDLIFTIVSDKEEVLRAGIESCSQGTEHHGTINCSDNQTRQLAHENHCSVGKYSAYEELVQYDDTVTIEECRDMSMHEIHNRINDCKSHHGTSGSSSTNSSNNTQNNEESGSSTEYDYSDDNASGHHSEHHH